MVRRYRRRIIANRDKYSVENTVCTTPPIANWTLQEATETTQINRQFEIAVVPPSDEQGMRKVKHLTLSFSAGVDYRFFYALVYVPAGYEPNFLTLPAPGLANPLYEPNQFVMSSGVLDFTGGPLRIRTPLSRNLNSGDSIHLVIASNTTGANDSVSMNVQYAITLQ